MKKIAYIFLLLITVLLTGQMMMDQSGTQNLKVTGNDKPDGFNNKLNLPSDNGGVLGILVPDGKITINAQTVDYNVFPGNKTNLLVYEANYKNTEYYYPVIKVKKGRTLDIDLSNRLDENTIIHWHGILTESKYDGLPQQKAVPGGIYAYSFKITNRGGFYWYHTHAHKMTARQAYMGLAGLLIVEDDDNNKLDDSLNLKFGINDIPLVIQDKRFDNDNNLLYNPSQMEEVMGFYGENILVNLTPKPYLDVNKGIYRFRILNGSNSRNYKLALLNGNEKMEFKIIGTDGGLLDRPYPSTEVFIAPGERIEILVDFSDVKSGNTVFLKSLRFDPMHNEGMMSEGMMPNGMMDNSDNALLPEGSDIYILKFNVIGNTVKTAKIPDILSKLEPVNANNLNIRKFTLSFSMMNWYINGLSFDMNDYPVVVKKNTKEIWEIYNSQISMPHPMHIHGVQFRIIERVNSPMQVKTLAIDKNGRLVTDLGWKDTVLIWPDESVRILVDFTNDYKGNQDYVYHCHNLEHEDNGMMINYRITD